LIHDDQGQGFRGWASDRYRSRLPTARCQNWVFKAIYFRGV